MYAASDGNSLYDAVQAIVIGAFGSHKQLRMPSRRSNLFSSESVVFSDDNGEKMGPPDVQSHIYKELAEMYVGPTDWILGLFTVSRKFRKNNTVYIGQQISRFTA